MAGQIGEAFVRVRPDTSGFKSDVSRNVTRDLRGVERQLQSSNREFGRFSRGALVGTGALRELGRAAAFASLSFIGGAGIVVGIKSTVAAAMEAQVVLGQTENAVRRAGLSWDQYGKQIQDAATATSRLSGFDDERLLRTFSTLVRRTGDVNQALKLNALAADVARGRNIELEQASQLVLRASLGQAGALRRLGIDARKGASGIELVQLLSEKYANSARKFGETAAGAQARFQVAIQNTQELIGAALLPKLTTLLDKGATWLEDSRNQERIQKAVNTALKDGTAIAQGFADALDRIRAVGGPVVNAVGGLKNAVELLVGLAIARKLQTLTRGIGLVGTEATAARGAAGAGGVLGLGSALRGLPTAIAVTYTVTEVLQTKSGGKISPGLSPAGFLFQKIGGKIPGLGGPGLDEKVQALVNDRTVGLPGFGGTSAIDILTNATQTFTKDGALDKLPPGATKELARLQTRAEKTSIALAKAQSDFAIRQTTATKRALVVASNARLGYINDTIAFANKLISQRRGNTKALSDTLTAFYSDRSSTQGIIDQIAADDAKAAKDAQDAADRREKRDKAIRDAASKAERKRITDTYNAVEAQGKEAQRLQDHLIGALKKADADRVAAAKRAAEAQIARAQGQADIGLQILENNLARAKTLPAKKTAEGLIVQFWTEEAKRLGENTYAGQVAIGQKIQAQDDFAALFAKDKKAAAKAKALGGGFTLAELFSEAGREFALYGGNVGGGGTPLSAQDARGALAGTVKASQTVVVQNFWGERGTAQAMNDARAGARNLKG